ncbi:MAG: DUF808 domain-containing protein [Azoarcus sp.]|jgi:predicted DNA repair protein MutK|nr:DUF808 domain-containing protein [Azoarcus sp.]
MAGASLLALIDDIAAILDDVALMTKVAAKKTAGVLGDDLALNAQQVAGVRAERELPVVWAVARGSLVNKAILVPVALLISAFLPWAITPLLMAGGLYLCLEGMEKIAHGFPRKADGHGAAAPRQDVLQKLADPDVDLVHLEKEKIRGAIRTDFVLSTEIIVIALGTVAGETMSRQIAVLIGIALLITAGVYGLVAVIVKLDDLGLYLHDKGSSVARAAGRALLLAAPLLMKFLTVAGTVAMFMVGGGILAHGLPIAHHLTESLSGAAGFLLPTLVDIAVGLAAGALALAGLRGAQRLRNR